MSRYFAASIPSTSKRVIEDLEDDDDDDTESHDAPAGKDDDGDEDDDFMSDKYLVAAKEVESKQSKSYSEKRREAIRRGEERGHIKSRAVREREARDEGLRQSLIAKETAAKAQQDAADKQASLPASDNKALSMMLKMGFKPGQALGKALMSAATTASSSAASTEDEGNEDEDDGFISLSAGLGAKKRAAPAAAIKMPRANDSASDHRRVDPLEIRMRSGRAGFGVDEAKRRRLADEVSSAEKRTTETVDQYRDRVQANHLERKAEGQLVAARKTCKDLDTAHGYRGENYRWLDPKEEENRKRAAIWGDRTKFGVKSRLGDFSAEVDEDANGFGDDQYKNGGLDGEIDVGLEGEIFEDQELQQRHEEKEAFLLMDARGRLKNTVEYLRQAYSYCLWCGAQYANKAEMDAECPGEEEEEH